MPYLKGVSWIVCDHGAFRVDEQKLENEDEGAITPYTPENRQPTR